MIVFDCTTASFWSGHPTGINRVIEQLGKELIRQEPSAALAVFDDEGQCREFSLETKELGRVLEIRAGDLVVSAGSNWDYPDHHARLLKLRDEDVKLGILFYDIIPILLPHSFGPGFPPIYQKWLNESLKNCDIAFSISINTKNDIIKYCNDSGIAAPSIYPIRLGDEISTSTTPPSIEIAKKVQEPFILSVGTLEYRKNHVLLLNAYRYMIQELNFIPPKLYLVGKPGWLGHDVDFQVANDNVLRDRVEVLQGLPDEDLQLLYEKALFTVFPSHYEGWGLPIAESLNYGKVCIASRKSSMTEIAPDLVRYAHPLLLTEWADQIMFLAKNPEVLKTESQKIISTYKRRTWKEAADQLLNAIGDRFS